MAATKKLPIVMVHVRITGVTPDLADTEPLRDALVALVQQYADQWGLRVKRRRVSLRRGVEVYAQYEQRAKLHRMIE